MPAVAHVQRQVLAGPTPRLNHLADGHRREKSATPEPPAGTTDTKQRNTGTREILSTGTTFAFRTGSGADNTYPMNSLLPAKTMATTKG
ncbi:MAG: hypothetical protein K0Q46_893 [Rhodococcus erythropolis]|nr:hypothetical protein [Rhodococcus erythropolis]